MRMKKHYSQMTYDEIHNVKNIISNKRNHGFSNHAKKRMKEKYISEYDVYSVFKAYEIIEVNTNGTDLRVLLRSAIKNNNNESTIISMDLSTGYIITAYKNNYLDNHNTIVWDNYNRNIRVDTLCKNVM